MRKVVEKPFQDNAGELPVAELRKKFDELAKLRGGEDNPQRFVVDSTAQYLKKGDKVLDVGAGGGKYAIAINKLGMEVTAFDFSRGAHDIMREEKGRRGVKFEQMMADATRLPYREGSFDGAIFFGTSAFIRRDDVGRCLGEIERVLKPGGILIAGFPSTSSQIYTISKSPFNSSKTLKVIGFKEAGLSEDIPLNFFDREDFESYMSILKKSFSLKEFYHGSIMIPMGAGEAVTHWNWCLIAEKKQN